MHGFKRGPSLCLPLFSNSFTKGWESRVNCYTLVGHVRAQLISMTTPGGVAITHRYD